MQALDRRAINEGHPGATLMEQAGAGAVACLAEIWGNLRGKTITLFCGKGNNGGDGLWWPAFSVGDAQHTSRDYGSRRRYDTRCRDDVGISLEPRNCMREPLYIQTSDTAALTGQRLRGRRAAWNGVVG